MCDTSLFGKGKNGIVFTENAVYFKDTFGSVKSCHFDENWNPGQSDVFELLDISPSNAFFDCFALTDLLNELAELSARSGGELPSPAEQPAPETSPAPEAPSPEEKKPEEKPDSDDDEDDDDDDDVSFLDLLGVALDVTEDPSR